MRVRSIWRITPIQVVVPALLIAEIDYLNRDSQSPLVLTVFSVLFLGTCCGSFCRSKPVELTIPPKRP